MIRGWRYIGRLSSNYSSWADHLFFADEGEPIVIDVGDVLATASSPSGPLRPGYLQITGVDQRLHSVAVKRNGSVPAIAAGDYVFVATALGDNAFKRRSNG